jgi:hypothetical protein
MDRAWTGNFFNFHLPEWQDAAGQRRIFQLAYDQFVKVAQQAGPEQYVTNTGWRTSRTKIIDNALIGFCKLELADDTQWQLPTLCRSPRLSASSAEV